MDRKSFINGSYVLGKEILVYQLPQNKRGNWYCRFSDPLGNATYIRKSCKTANYGLAVKKAIDLYNEMNAKASIGAGVLETTWDLVFNKFLHQLSPRRRELANDFNQRYWANWFGSKDNVSDFFKITEDDLENYWAFRLSYWEDNDQRRYAAKDQNKSSPNALRMEGYILKHFFVKAFQQNYIRSLPDVLFKDTGHRNVLKLPSDHRRGRFDEESARIIRHWWSTTRRRLMDTRNGLVIDRVIHDDKERNWKYQKDDRVTFNHPQNRYSLALTYMITILAANTGGRPVELVKLKWKDVECWTDPDDGRQYTIIQIRKEVSKVNKHRDMISRDFRETYDRLMEFKYEWARCFGREPTGDDYIFGSVGAFKKKVTPYPARPHQSVRNLLMRLKTKNGESIYKEMVDGVAVPRTLYSFRSLFITESLRRGMDAYTIARACGTSIEMIERYYDYNKNIHFRKDITRHLKTMDFAGSVAEE
jgi:integrase